MTQTLEPAVFPLATNLDHDGLRELAEFLASSRGGAVRIDGAAADQVGAQAAQILAVAQQTWASDEVDFGIADPTGAVAASLGRLGLSGILFDPSRTEGAAA